MRGRKGRNVMRDILTEEGVRAHLAKDSPVRRVVCLDTVDSTNTCAKRLALAGAEDGTLVVANHQTAGRGRRGRAFYSPADTGLYMTLILRPPEEIGRFQLVTVAAAVAVCLTLEELASLRPRIKWVNDILIGPGGAERKVCGILAEAVGGAESGVESVVVGIGLNVTTRGFCPGLEGVAGSIFPDGAGEAGLPRRDQLAAGIAERLMDLGGRPGDPEVIAAYRQRSMLLGRDITYAVTGAPEGETRRGRALDIDERGSLVIRDEAGEVIALRSGEVFQVRPAAESRMGINDKQEA